MQEVPQTDLTGMSTGGRLREQRSIGELFRELADETRMLLQQEVQLAKAEMGQKLDKATNSAASIGIGGAVALAGLITLCGAASAGLFVLLRNVMDVPFMYSAWLAPLIVGGIVAGIGYGLIQSGITNLKKERLVPRKTADSLRETKEWMQEKVS